MRKIPLILAAAIVAASPIQAQRAVAFEGGLFGAFTKFEGITTLDNGLGIGGHLDAYLLRRLALELASDFHMNSSGRTGNDLTVVNHRIDAVYNHPLNNRWRLLLGGGWTGTHFNGDKTKNEYDSGLNALAGLRYCVNDNWSWKGDGLVDFKDPADQTPAFNKTRTFVLRFGVTRFFGGQAKNGPCINAAPAEPLPAPPPPAQTAPAAAAPAPTPTPPPQPQPQQQEPAPAPAPARRELLSLIGNVFEFDRSTLTAGAKDTLQRAVAVLTANPTANVEIQGHTDSKGSDEYNQRLSIRRAESVKAYLVSQGISATRISTQGFGESQPAASNDTAAGRAINRRAVIIEIRRD